MSKILTQLNYETLEHIAKDFHQEGEDIARIHRTLSQKVNSLHGKWVGRAADAFFAEMEDELLPSTERLARALLTSETILNQIVKTFHDADSQTVNYYKNLGEGENEPHSGKPPGLARPVIQDTEPPLSSELWEHAQQAAAEFGVPPELVAGILAAEQEHDYTMQDSIEDTMARTALTLIEAGELNREVGWPAQDSSWQGWVMLGLIEQVDLSLGVGQVRLSTAQGVAEYVANHPELGLSKQYPQDLDVRDLVARLEDPEWNARYVAGYVRQLLDSRAAFEASGDVDNGISEVERMQIIYWAYRAGPGALLNESPNVDMYPNTPEYDPAPALDLSPDVIQYYQDLLKNGD